MLNRLTRGYSRDDASRFAAVHTSEVAEFSRLVGAIYDCALDPELWDETLTAIRKLIRAETAAVSLGTLDGQLLFNKAVGPEGVAILEGMQEHAAEVAVWTARHVASTPPETPLIISRHPERETFWRTSAYAKALRALGLVDAMQFHLDVSDARFSAFATARHERQGIVTDHEIELCRLLLPHLRRAVTISNVLDARTIEQARMAEALDAFACGVVLLKADGLVLHANRSAAAMLAKGDVLLERGGRLEARSDSAMRELREAVSVAARDEARLGKEGLSVRLTGVGDEPALAHVLPMGASDLRTRLQPTAVAAVFVGGATDAARDAEAIARAFDLTPAETRLLARLLRGDALREAAAGLGVARTTARTHLNSIFSKTGVGRQADLSRLARRVLPPLR